MNRPLVSAPLLVALLASACSPHPGPATAVVAGSSTPNSPAATSTHLPTPVPVTRTPAPLPAARLFTEEFDGPLPYWLFLHAGLPIGSPFAAPSAGTLRFELPGLDEWAYGVYDGPVYEDVRVDAVTTLDGSSSAGLICRYDPALGWYEFNVHPDGTYALLFGQWLADGIVRYLPLVVAQSDQILATANEIGLACQGDILTPFINGTQIRRRQETQHVLTAGKVGVSAASFADRGATVSFDWVSVGDP